MCKPNTLTIIILFSSPICSLVIFIFYMIKKLYFTNDDVVPNEVLPQTRTIIVYRNFQPELKTSSIVSVVNCDDNDIERNDIKN